MAGGKRLLFSSLLIMGMQEEINVLSVYSLELMCLGNWWWISTKTLRRPQKRKENFYVHLFSHGPFNKIRKKNNHVLRFTNLLLLFFLRLVSWLDSANSLSEVPYYLRYWSAKTRSRTAQGRGLLNEVYLWTQEL